VRKEDNHKPISPRKKIFSIYLKSSPIIKNPKEIICRHVFNLDNLLTSISGLFSAKNSLNPETKTSLTIITKEGKINNPSIFEIATRINIIEITRILSAIGSKNLPKILSIENFLAIYPSKKSDRQAKIYNDKAIQLRKKF
tara:strand:+ start:619 stop:1041 length:423 start_codon:yes stop_codon:yes gene_type:complete